jgi:hypothetical protein
MDEIPTLTALEPFRRDPITNFFVKRPWYIATIAGIGIYLVGVGAAAIDGTLFEIPARTPPYPAGCRRCGH